MRETVNNKPTVFISYSHKDEVWKDRLREHLGVLEMEEYITVWDDRAIEAGENWYDEIKDSMADAAVAICLISAPFLGSGFVKREEIPYLLERRERDGMTLIPILLRPCLWKAAPWLKKSQMLPQDGRSVANHFSDDGDEIFAEVANQIYEILNDPDYRPPAPPPPEWPAPEKIDLHRLPQTGAELFGRDSEMTWLDQQWDSGEVRVVSLIAWGGVGKSTLVNRWLEKMARDNYRGAGKVFAWSFYSQGTGERVTSADQFIHEALTWFGDKNPLEGSPWDKGQRLAALVREASALLVLDGMEPLQADNAVERGKVKDPALATLLQEMALSKGASKGLCLITSRVNVADLREFSGVCSERGLEQIATASGRALLRVGGVQGSDAALESASEAFGNHAFALNLLAAFLYQQMGHHISHTEKVPCLEAVSVNQGRHARRVIAAFEDLLGEGPDLALLRLLGLFDRPLEKAPLEALLSEPVIPGLTEPLLGQNFDALLRPLNRLRCLSLIAEESQHRPDSIDAHPLVREHFKDWLKEHQPEAWKTANSRLFDYYRKSAKEHPDTLSEMAPLFLAMGHGCAAGRFQEALDEVYWVRILRKDAYYALDRLGAFGSGLIALSGLFRQPYCLLVSVLSESDQGFVLNEVGFCLRATGRLTEAVQPLKVGLKFRVKQEDWKNAAVNAENISTIQITLGNLAQSRMWAEVAQKWADRSEDFSRRVANRTTLADSFLQSGFIGIAEALFEEAEQIQKKNQPEYPLLYSRQGYRYCVSLLARGSYGAVQERAEAMFAWRARPQWKKKYDPVVNIALDHLSLGCTHLFQAQAEGVDDWKKATQHLTQAVEKFRESGSQADLPLGLLARATLFRLQGRQESAQRDLDETFRLAGRCGMRLFEADAHLEQARLDLARNQSKSARKHLDHAKALIKECGYHRRDGEVEALEKELKTSPADRMNPEK